MQGLSVIYMVIVASLLYYNLKKICLLYSQ